MTKLLISTDIKIGDVLYLQATAGKDLAGKLCIVTNIIGNTLFEMCMEIHHNHRCAEVTLDKVPMFYSKTLEDIK